MSDNQHSLGSQLGSPERPGTYHSVCRRHIAHPDPQCHRHSKVSFPPHLHQQMRLVVLGKRPQTKCHCRHLHARQEGTIRRT